MEFKIVKKSKKSRARLGLLKTSHGVVETPCLVPVATQASIKTLTSEEVLQTGSQMLICNTYHLHLRPGENVVKKFGSLHRFMNWQKPLMTDSGGFQVFSLGFGRDLGTGKILKSKQNRFYEVKKGQQPKLLKITEKEFISALISTAGKRSWARKNPSESRRSLGQTLSLPLTNAPLPRQIMNIRKNRWI